MQYIIESIKKHEGYKAQVYKCTEGYDTIGYGFAIKDLWLSEDVCDIILKEKLENILAALEQKLPWFTNAPVEVRLVLCNMVYQMGLSGTLLFKKALGAMKEKNWSKAAEEMLDSKWALQTPNRANELADLIRNISE